MICKRNCIHVFLYVPPIKKLKTSWKSKTEHKIHLHIWKLGIEKGTCMLVAVNYTWQGSTK